MSEEDLCWKCKEEMKGFVIFQNVHCHHEPEEKKKCWCMQPESKRVPTKIPIGVDFSNVIEWRDVKFCPECGRKL
jgi:hypothetical protein